MLTRTLLSALVAVAVTHLVGAQAVVPTSAYRSQHVAIGVVNLTENTRPLIVEATRDGWVYVDVVSSRREGAAFPLPSQLIVEGREVRAWLTNARLALHQPPTDEYTNIAPLGRGANALGIGFGPKKYPSSYISFGCRAANNRMGATREEISQLFTLLDSAVAVAGTGEGRPPTLGRPYYASEVSCAAAPVKGNATPRLPANYRGALPEVGTAFVVDTAGRVERNSIRVLPGTAAAIAASVRATVADWRFDRAEWDGTPLRQLLQTAVKFTPEPPESPLPPSGRATLALVPTGDGWVRLDVVDMYGRPLHEWIKPNDLDAWVARIDTRALRDSALRSRYNTAWEDLGVASGFVLTGAWSRVTPSNDSLMFRTSLHGCDASVASGGSLEKPLPLTAYVEAAAAARSLRATPAVDRRAVHEPSDVSCQALVQWAPLVSRVTRGGWHYPLGPYTSEMKVANARIEVLVSVVVDTLGRADPRTLQVISGADPRAVPQLRKALEAVHYRAAVRGREPVAQRVIQLVRFEPPPICPSVMASPFCARKYSER